MVVFFLQFLLWIFGNFGIVQELRDVLKKDIFFLVFEFNFFEKVKKIFQFYYFIVDVFGDVIVIEFIEQGRMVFDNIFGILINFLFYDFYLMNVCNYVEFFKLVYDFLVLGKMMFEVSG